MASVEAVSAVISNCSRHTERISCISEETLCANCLTMKDYVQVLTTELKSAQLIIKILQDDLKSNMLEPTTTENLPTCVNSIEWRLVWQTKTDLIEQHQYNNHNHNESLQYLTDTQFWITSTSILRQREHVNTLIPPKGRGGRITDSVSAVQQIKRRGECNKKTSDKKQNKIIIIGDSHARRCVHGSTT